MLVLKPNEIRAIVHQVGEAVRLHVPQMAKQIEHAGQSYRVDDHTFKIELDEDTCRTLELTLVSTTGNRFVRRIELADFVVH